MASKFAREAAGAATMQAALKYASMTRGSSIRSRNGLSYGRFAPNAATDLQHLALNDGPVAVDNNRAPGHHNPYSVQPNTLHA